MKPLSLLTTTSTCQAILAFLCRNPQASYYSGEIADKNSLSKGGTNQTLRELAKRGVVKTRKKGRMVFYSVDIQSPFIRQFKVLQTISILESINNKIKPLAERIVLFGSCAKGEDTEDSDIDLLVVSREKDRVRQLIPETKAKRKIQLLVKSPQEYIQLEIKEPVFFKELEQGIVLWQKE